MYIPLLTVVSVTFYSEQRTRNVQIISAARNRTSSFLIYTHVVFPLFPLSPLSFFLYSIHRGMIVDYRSLLKRRSSYT